MTKKVFYFIKETRGGTDTLLSNILSLKLNGIEQKAYLLRKATHSVLLNSNIRIVNRSYPSEYGFSIIKVKKTVNNMNKIIQIIKREKPEIICALDNYTAIILLFLKKISFKFPKVVLFVNNNIVAMTNIHNNLLYKYFVHSLIKYFYQTADKIICPSKELKFNLILDLNIKSDKLVYIPNFLRVKTIFKKRRIKNFTTLISVGRLDDQKDYMTIFQALFELNKEYRNFRFILVGDGDNKNKLYKYAGDLNLSDKILFVGWQKKVDKYLKVSDVFLFSSNYEGSSYAILEAMTHSLPIVASKTPFGIKELVKNNHCGILVPMKKHYEFKNAIIKLLTDKKKYSTFAKNAYVSSKKYETKCIKDRFFKLYHHL